MCYYLLFTENNPPSEASPRKSNRIGQKPITYADQFGGTASRDGGTNSMRPEVEIPKDLPITPLIDKPIPQIGK